MWYLLLKTKETINNDIHTIDKGIVFPFVFHNINENRNSVTINVETNHEASPVSIFIKVSAMSLQTLIYF